MTNYVLFSIDNVADTHTLAKFLRHMDTQIVMGKTEGLLVQCIGSYKGKLELSFILNEKDYIDHVLPLEFTKGQECVLQIVSDYVWMATSFDYDYNCPREWLGHMKQVSKKKALKSDGFTYRPDLDAYFVIK